MFTIDQFIDQLQPDIPLKKPNQCWVAYSGGLDSHVLLHALCQVRKIYPDLTIKAIHVNHGMSNNADEWAEHCVQVCQSLAVECIVKRVDVLAVANKQSIEETARNLRYQAFKEVVNTGNYLLMAHHQDDLAETFLLQALRGAGPKGLASMPSAKFFYGGMLLRPLLKFSRTSLKQYANAQELLWQEDESNADERFDRNYLRKHIMPLLSQRFAGATLALSRAAKHCAEANQLLETLAQQDLRDNKGDIEDTLSISSLLKISEIRQKNLLRLWIKQQGYPLPSSAMLNQLQKDVLSVKQDAYPRFSWQGAEIYRYQDNLYILQPLLKHDNTLIVKWDMSQPLVLHNIGKLQAYEETAAGLLLPDIDNITVRFRQGGERIHPEGRSGSRPLKKLFQEWGVPPWLRDRIPLVFYHDTLVMVVGYAISKDYVARDDRRGKLVLVDS
jgi:tRNA(Ile)-lysidine synthase